MSVRATMHRVYMNSHFLRSETVDRVSLIVCSTSESDIFQTVFAADCSWNDVIFFNEVLCAALLTRLCIYKRALACVAFPNRSANACSSLSVFDSLH
jgi:hypothetical protein